MRMVTAIVYTLVKFISYIAGGVGRTFFSPGVVLNVIFQKGSFCTVLFPKT